MHPYYTPSFISRFWRYVDRSGDCWLWTKGKTTDGYGVIAILKGDIWSKRYAHRVSYELTYGIIPDEFFVCHRCDNPTCVRPDHLFLGTAKDNSRDMSSKGRSHAQAKPESLARGEHNGSSVLTDAQVREIRAKYTHRYGSVTHLSREYGVSLVTIRIIVTRKGWKHI